MGGRSEIKLFVSLLLSSILPTILLWAAIRRMLYVLNECNDTTHWFDLVHTGYTYRHKKSVNILLPFTLQGLRIATDNKQQPKSTPKYITPPFSYRIRKPIATLFAILNSKRSSTYTTHRHSLLHCFAICYDSKVAKF